MTSARASERSASPVTSTQTSYRGFSSDLERQAAEWIAHPVTTHEWKPNGRNFGGESSETLGVTDGRALSASSSLPCAVAQAFVEMG